MRVRLRLLDADAEALPLIGGEGALWHRRLLWQTATGRLDLRVLAAEPVSLPEVQAAEPVEGAIARVVQAIHGTGSLLLLANPAEALGRQRIRSAEGVRLLAVEDEADRACWDAALEVILPMYGVLGDCVCEVSRPRPANVLSALAYGGFLSCAGLVPEALREDRRGVQWTLPEAGEAAVIVRGGFPCARIAGISGAWEDRGSEGYVRLELSAPSGHCLTQPRFIAPDR